MKKIPIALLFAFIFIGSEITTKLLIEVKNESQIGSKVMDTILSDIKISVDSALGTSDVKEKINSVNKDYVYTDEKCSKTETFSVYDKEQQEIENYIDKII